ncbi:flagellar hook protein FlgE [Stutzerimonas kirkiae]|uniref:Flagellar hook protein FlgE n=1 Tax=Stutzerimonas kirkiae TaxID=2211392 RepID=A0A4Q9RFJ5_9GAMM|nr:flagellar hook protein FlgE [Stutzerimonas kirkiae]TBU99977.1 flagellar hook protein FlgE [Stutzerimonas kirkiae]TBV05683.1 flagellar hook protein FlgE [Stutzerimonas kirkiae]TBV10574.1 flagellar hook protein FlgE [Stutzerimonas kirkiae]TBV17432.1 flagellar hook protein FlgE [Stutzerimonas kirkiae]
MSFNTALSGLKAASTYLNVTGNNIANTGTTGFKYSRAEFADLYASSMFGTGSNSVGSGVLTSDIAQQFTQGNITYTDNSLDLAINGSGYFIVNDGGSQLYTRSGAFKVDNQGNVVDSSGNNLMGYGVDSDGNLVNGVLTNLVVDTTNQEPNATTSVTQSLALNSAASLPTTTPFDSSISTSYNWSTSATLYDSQGNAHTMSQYFVKTDSNEWSMYVLVDGRNPQDPTSTDPYEASLPFTTAGKLDTSNLASGDFTINADGTLSLSDWVPAAISDATTDPVTWASNGAAASTSGITLDLRTMTQTNTSFSVNSLYQDGYTTGQLSGLSVDETGQLFATYTNGQSKVIGQTALATFANMQGLTPVGGTAWRQSLASGEPVIGTPGSGTLGAIAAGALEDSNVDLTSQLVDLIVAQRNYQANAKTIETENTISQTIINIR